MNYAAIPANQTARRQTVARLVIVITIVVMQFSFIPLSTVQRAGALDPLTVGGLIALADLALGKLNNIAQDTLNNAGQEVRDSVRVLREQISSLRAELEQTYQDNLSVTIDSIDALTANKLIELQNLVEAVNDKLQEDIKLIAQETKDVIITAATEVRQLGAELQQRLTNVVVITSEAVVYVIDRTMFNVVLIISLILLGVGLLVFVWIIFSRKLPEGIMRPIGLLMMVAFVVLFGLLALVPRVRAQVMRATGIGEEFRRVIQPVPEVIGVEPRVITLGVTQSVRLIGVNLRPADKPVAAMISNVLVPVVAADREAVLTVDGLVLSNGSYEAVLLYDNVEAPRTRILLEIKQQVTPPPPPDLTISSFTISPTSPTAKAGVTATITISNQGGSAAGPFQLRWDMVAGTARPAVNVAGLAANATQTFTFTDAYTFAGTVDSVVTVDVNNTVAEGNEGNNQRSITGIVVRPEPTRVPTTYTVSVRFTQLRIIDDADPFDSGEIWLDFTVGGQTRRFPAVSVINLHSGDTLGLSEVFVFTVSENSRYTLSVVATDQDSPPIDNNDPLGEIEHVYDKTNSFGSGSYSWRSDCPDGCFQLSYSITVTQN